MARRPKSTPLTVISGDFSTGRAPPPASLSKRAATIWRETVETEPTDLFSTAATKALLADYCRARETAETYTKLIEGFRPEWLATEDGLIRFRSACRGRDVETRAALTLATKLRLTNSSRYTEKTAATLAKHSAKGARPWES